MRGPDDEDAAFDVDSARVRWEDLLLSLPYDRALPNLPDLLDRAGVSDALLRRDERLLKVLHEAVLARPLSQQHEAHQLRTEVELLTLEVELLTDRLSGHGVPREDAEAAVDRLQEVQERLDEIQDTL